MKYDTTWFHNRLVSIEYYKDSSALLIKFKDGSQGVITAGELFNIKSKALPDSLLKTMEEAEEKGHSNINDK
jgi:hypothetical protein